MARAAANYEGRAEFWKPAEGTRRENEMASPHCWSCGAECVPDSLYCHVCGSDQAAVETEAGRYVPAVFRLAYRALSRLASHSMLGLASRLAFLRDALGQTSASFGALLAGCFCLVAAGVIGFFFSVTKLLDWQAVQLWRIEWLLAAIAFLVAGILLKKK
ncbi:MAG TPA: hypothetical protein VKL40_12200 [Candidatus Angelobacter sp.]|nr:hypothetical protein [Candidatus Angelobacter sp.]